MSESIFMQIIKGDIPSHKVYEDDKTLAFLDIHPAQPGHTLVIPKTPVEFVWDLPDEDYQALMKAVQKVAKRLREVFAHKKRVGLVVEGLDVLHAHIHLIPFDNPAEFHAKPDMNAEPDHEALALLAKKLYFEDN